ncbi:MAG: FAD-dependent monooxygenase [Pseudomonadota bacterium]
MLVAGGGVAGLAAALALARAGHRVLLAERRGDTGALGAGIQLSPNATRCLAALGVLARLEAAAFRPRAAVLRDGRDGRIVYRAALASAAEARWGAPYLHIHRGDLVAALAAAAGEAGVEIRTATAVAPPAAIPASGPLTLTLEEEGACEDREADLLVAADGLGSRLRPAIAGPAEPRFTGQTAWRACLPADRIAADRIAPEATVWAAPGRHLVSYYIRGGALLNLVAVEEATAWQGESWAEPGDPAALRAAFADFHPAVTAALDAVEKPLLWGLFERPAPPAWSRGAAVLIGDACHPMLPFMAQGAAMGIEDATVLARCLDAEAAIPAALTRFERLRRPRTTRVQAVSRANGRMFHRADGLARTASFAGIAAVSRLAPALAAGRLDWLYGHDATRG